MNTLQKSLVGAMLAVAVGTVVFVTVVGHVEVQHAEARPSFAPAPATATATELSFGPLIERVVGRDEADAQGFVFLSLKGGKIIKPALPSPPRKGRGVNFPELTPELRQWILANDADALLLLEDEWWSLATLDTLQAPAFASPPDQLDQLPPQCIVSDVCAINDQLPHVRRGEVTAPPVVMLRAGYDGETNLCELVWTRRGEWLVWNWTGLNTTPRGVKLRYRLVQPTDANATFGPAIERVLYSVAGHRPINGEDLDKGREIEVPAELEKAGEEKLFHWLATQGVDLLVLGHQQSWDLWINTRLIPVLALTWERPTKVGLLAALAGWQPSYAGLPRAEPDDKEGFISYRLDADAIVPVTSAFQTSAGGLGLLQFAGFTDHPRGVKIRYKMMRPVPQLTAVP